MHLSIIPRTLPYGGFQSQNGLVPGWGNRLTGDSPAIYKLGRVMHGRRPEYECSRAVLLRKRIIKPFCHSNVMQNCHCHKVDITTPQRENSYAILAGYAYMNIVAHQYPQVQMAFMDSGIMCQNELVISEPGVILDVCV